MADLMYLRSFIAMYRSGSIKKASQYLNLSQPAVSGQLRILETQIGKDLFTRTSRGIIPTAAGHELARSSGPHIDALELLGERAQISDYEGTVHLGGPVEFLTQRVLPSLSQLVRNGLGFRVTLASPDRDRGWFSGTGATSGAVTAVASRKFSKPSQFAAIVISTAFSDQRPAALRQASGPHPETARNRALKWLRFL